MRHHKLLIVLATAMVWLPADAQSRGRVSAGATLWTSSTDLQVKNATDFDGSNTTTSEQEKDWDALGSGAGVRLSYDFPKLVMLYGELGTTQATIRDKDVVDSDQDVDSRGLDDGTHYALGARLGGDFSGSGHMFWNIGATLSGVSAVLDEDINTTWEYDETRIAVDGKVGMWAHRVGFYGGVRFVESNADLQETDLSNSPGQQTRTIELERAGTVDLLLGGQTRGSDVFGFAEIGLVGTYSATVGIGLGF